MIVISKINQLIFFFDFSRCLEKVDDNKEFRIRNSKPHQESEIMTL